MDSHDQSEVQALRGIGGNLLARGLKVTETTSDDGLVELASRRKSDGGEAEPTGRRLSAVDADEADPSRPSATPGGAGGAACTLRDS
jgi:uncharacterized protein YbjT (DUF2867 family)